MKTIRKATRGITVREMKYLVDWLEYWNNSFIYRLFHKEPKL